jgi:hypothetical protein
LVRYILVWFVLCSCSTDGIVTSHNNRRHVSGVGSCGSSHIMLLWG